MHYMGKTFYAEVLFYFYSSDLADLSDIVSSQVYQHVMFRQLFLIFQKSLFKGFILFSCFSSWSGSCQREGT